MSRSATYTDDDLLDAVHQAAVDLGQDFVIVSDKLSKTQPRRNRNARTPVPHGMDWRRIDIAVETST